LFGQLLSALFRFLNSHFVQRGFNSIEDANIVHSNPKGQEIKMSKPTPSHYNLIALCFAIALGAAALAVGLGNDSLAVSQAPVTKMLVAECQGFDALATAGGKSQACQADQPAAAVEPDHDGAPTVEQGVVPAAEQGAVPAALRSKV
jgi:hypothetical protein